jgi:hypothetical protein
MRSWANAGDAIDLGSAVDTTANTLELSDAELDNITASTLRIGDGAAGAITLSADISPANVTDVHLLTGGGVTGTAGGIDVATGLAITAGDGVNITDTNTEFTNLSVSNAGNHVTIMESDGFAVGDVDTLQGVSGVDIALTASTGGITVNNGGAASDLNATGDLVITANGTGGAITDAAGAGITVTDLATLNAGTNAITLGDEVGDTTHFGSLAVTGGAVTITEDSATDLAGVNATSLNLTSAGTITDAAATNLTVSGLATLNAGTNAITLGDEVGDTTHFGSLAVTGGAVTITEDSATDLAGVNATSLNLTSAGTITDAAATTLTVSGLATLNAGTNAITLGDEGGDTTNFGSLDVTGGAVTITEDSATELAGANVTSLDLTSVGAITDSGSISASSLSTTSVGGTVLDVGHSVSKFTASNTGSGNITFNNSGTLSLDAANSNGNVTVVNSGDILLGLVNAAGNTVDLTATGSDADILNNNGLDTNVKSRIVNMTAGWRIGESISEPITLDIDPAGEINLTFGAAKAYIRNLNQTPVSLSQGSVVDSVATAIAGAGRAQDVELAEVGFVDWSLFSEDLSLFGVVEPGIKLPKDQIEDDLVLKLPEPDVPLLLKIAGNWEYLHTFLPTSFLQPLK